MKCSEILENNLDDVIKKIRTLYDCYDAQQKDIEKWYKENENDVFYDKFGSVEGNNRYFRPSENEVTTHLIIPLLKALGWNENSIALELRPFIRKVCRADIILFDPPKRDGNEDWNSLVRCIIEVKNPWDGRKLETLRDIMNNQVEGYSKWLPERTSLIVTNGYEYVIKKSKKSKDFVVDVRTGKNLPELIDLLSFRRG